MIVIIDYGIGNLASVLNMFKKIRAKNVCISSDNSIIESYNKVLESFDKSYKKVYNRILFLMDTKYYKDDN